MDDELRVGLYGRVSSQQQTDEQTIDSQVDSLKKRIRDDGQTLDAELRFLDEGYSGESLLRPALERLRDLAYAGGLDRVYIHSPDRLARKHAYQVLLLEELNEHGVEVVFLNQDIQHQTDEGNLLIQMQGAFAEYERAKILERTRRGRRFAARQGKVSVLGDAPYGYPLYSQARRRRRGAVRHHLGRGPRGTRDIHLGRRRGSVVGRGGSAAGRTWDTDANGQVLLESRDGSRHPCKSGVHGEGALRENPPFPEENAFSNVSWMSGGASARQGIASYLGRRTRGHSGPRAGQSRVIRRGGGEARRKPSQMPRA